MALAKYQYRGDVIRELSSGRPLAPGEVVELDDLVTDEDKALVASRTLVYLDETDTEDNAPRALKSGSNNDAEEGK